MDQSLNVHFYYTVFCLRVSILYVIQNICNIAMTGMIIYACMLYALYNNLYVYVMVVVSTDVWNMISKLACLSSIYLWLTSASVKYDKTLHECHIYA